MWIIQLNPRAESSTDKDKRHNAHDEPRSDRRVAHLHWHQTPRGTLGPGSPARRGLICASGLASCSLRDAASSFQAAVVSRLEQA
eukprot:2636962-Rhodomonas_salina.1